MATFFKTMAVLAALCASGSAQPKPADPPLTLAGVYALNARSAFAWSDKGKLHIWRIDVSGVGANVPVRWTAIPNPPELAAFKDDSQNEGSPEVHVSFGPGAMIHVFWADQHEVEEARFNLVVHQAESKDEGRTWRMATSTLFDTVGVSRVYRCRFVDSQHGWMLLNGDPGASQLPEIIATTSDGGRIWRMVADWTHRGQVPLGTDGWQALIVRSATVASFMASQNGIVVNGSERDLAAAWTEDAGHTWIDTPISQSSESGLVSGVAVSELAQLRGDPMHPHHVCVDANLNAYDQQSDSYRYGDARYCSDDDGRKWSLPVRVPKPKAVIGDTGLGLRNASDLPVYADAALGFAVVWGDHKLPGWKPEGKSARLTSREFRLFVTTDAGGTWKPGPASLVEHLQTSDQIQIAQADAKGSGVWLLLTVPGDSPHSDLFFSADHGTTWRLLPIGQGPPSR